MKKTLFHLVLVAVLALLLVSCSQPAVQTDPWENAVYTEDNVFGNGSKTVMTEVIVGEHSVVFTLKTDKTILEEALTEHQLISGDKDTYGLYVKVVNGIRADYNEDQSYWALSKNGEPMQTGVSGATITDGEHYELIYTKIN